MCNTYTNTTLTNLLTYLIYTKSKSPQKGIPPARHGTRQFFSEFISTRDENASTFDEISTFFTSSDIIMDFMLIIFVKNLFMVKGNMFLYG